MSHQVKAPAHFTAKPATGVSNDSGTGVSGADAAPVFLTTREASQFLRLSEVSLARWRTEGRGPAFRKFNRRVVYSRADLLSWADAQKRLSTSDVSPQ